jgi:hypothetical protein
MDHAAQMDHVERQITDDDGVAAGQEPVRGDRQCVGVKLMDRGGRSGGLGNRLQRLPVVEVLMGGDDHLQLGCVLGHQFH